MVAKCCRWWDTGVRTGGTPFLQTEMLTDMGTSVDKEEERENIILLPP